MTNPLPPPEENEPLLNGYQDPPYGLSCAIYFLRTLLPHLSLSRTTLRALSEDQRSTIPKRRSFHALVQLFERPWDTYITLGGGMMDAMEHLDAVMVSLDEMRRLVLMAVSPFEGGGCGDFG